ncbi:hypothetical protein GGR54DRAFT_613901 [Hypoxylon sp. NC1633]|nr:hypothetical protein GGR54DRAFT_613901 [Hypoxylon sp. NC1633]
MPNRSKCFHFDPLYPASSRRPKYRMLVQGDTHEKFSSHPETFLTHTLPTIHKNTIVVAATHPSVQNGRPENDGWFLSDFYAFNYLLKGAVIDQTWLTAADPEQLLSKWGDYLHGHPFQDRKVVLNRDLLKSEITPVTVIQSAKMINRFLEEVSRASDRAKRGGCPLLIMAFCHGIGHHHLLLDNGNRKESISIVQLKAALDPGVSVTLFTTACYSGGWAITPDLNITAMTAATPDGQSKAWPVSDSMEQASGSMFVEATLATLSDVSTPLLVQDGSPKDPTMVEFCLQPEEPTELQTETYNEFCRTIQDILGAGGFSRILGNELRFSAQNDEWRYPWTGRSGIPLTYFSERWGKLTSYPPKLSQGVSNSLTRSVDDCIDEMTRKTIHSRVYGMAELFYQLCPGDWNRGWNVAIAGDLNNFLHGKPLAPSAYEIADIIFFRWDACLHVDRFVDHHGLHRPNNEICVMWHQDEYMVEKKRRFGRKEWDALYMPVWSALFDNGASIEPADHQGHPFSRPLDYIASAITETSRTSEDAQKAVNTYCEYVASIRKFHLERATTSPAVRHAGRDWLRSIGRGIPDEE